MKHQKGSAFRVGLLLTAYGLVHSLFASHWSKNLVESWLGQRARNGLYRPFFHLPIAGDHRVGNQAVPHLARP